MIFHTKRDCNFSKRKSYTSTSNDFFFFSHTSRFLCFKENSTKFLFFCHPLLFFFLNFLKKKSKKVRFQTPNKNQKNFKKNMPGTPGLFNWPVWFGSAVVGWFILENVSMQKYLSNPKVYEMNEQPPILPKAGDKGIVYATSALEQQQES
jgi:hypothetical protein